MPHIVRDGRRIHYMVQGTGPVVVLLHAIGLNSTWWSPYLDALGGSFTVVAIDMAGHGLSSPVTEPVEIFDHAADVAGVIDAVGGPAHLVGVSMGGMVAQALALDEPSRVASISLFSTMATLPSAGRAQVSARGTRARQSGLAASAEETLTRWVNPEDMGSPFAARCTEQILVCDLDSWAANWAAISRLDTLSRLGSVRCPALICTGSTDQSTPPDAARAIARAIPGAQLHILPGFGHMATFQHPGVFLDLLRSFMGGAAAP